VAEHACRVDSSGSDYWCVAMDMATCSPTSMTSHYRPVAPYWTSEWRFAHVCAFRDSDPGCRVLEITFAREPAARYYCSKTN